MSENLKPCPWCGSSDTEISANVVECMDCGASGPRQEMPEILCDRNIAIEAWNRRHQEQETSSTFERWVNK